MIIQPDAYLKIKLAVVNIDGAACPAVISLSSPAKLDLHQ